MCIRDSEYCVYFKLEEGRRHGGRAPGEEAVLRAFARTSFWFGRDTQRVGVLLEEVFEELEQRRTCLLYTSFRQVLYPYAHRHRLWRSRHHGFPHH